jgi:hypothetical protein
MGAKTNLRHGEGGNGKETAEYRAWASMLSRCSNESHTLFRHYGGRGISVCERWHTYENFLADMGRRPSANHSIDRISNDGNYEPSNCRWATSTEQNNNRRPAVGVGRPVRRLFVAGEWRTLADWLALVRIPATTFYRRVREGKPAEDVIREALLS